MRKRSISGTLQSPEISTVRVVSHISSCYTGIAVGMSTCVQTSKGQRLYLDREVEIVVTNPQHLHVTVEEYLRLDNESPDVCYDYIDGQLIKCAGGSPQHAEIAANVISILKPFLRGSSCHLFTSDVRIRFSASRYVHPDIAVSCDQRDWADPEAINYPSLVIEVLSPSTEARDRGQKFADYRACSSIREYVLINFAYQAVEVCRREKNPFWSFQTFTSGTDVELTSLGIRFPVADVYEGIFFPEGSDD